MKFKFKALIALSLLAFMALCAWMASAGNAKWPQQGSDIRYDGKLKVDISNVSDGYFMAAVKSKNTRKLKLRVTKDGETLTYDLNGNTDFEVFPLQLGSGQYTVQLYENVSGKQYSQAGKAYINVKLSREDAAFLVPSQYVNYTKKSDAVAEADKQGNGKSEKDTYKAICSFMKSRFVYDFIKAMTVKAGVLPDIDGCFKTKKGVCQDLSAIMVCMLRSQGIPARLMIGYADSNYHAWVVATVNGKEEFFDPTAELNAVSKVKKYTLERFY